MSNDEEDDLSHNLSSEEFKELTDIKNNNNELKSSTFYSIDKENKKIKLDKEEEFKEKGKDEKNNKELDLNLNYQSFLTERLKLIQEDLPNMKVKEGPAKIEKRQRMEYGKSWDETWTGGRRYGLFGPKSHHGKTFQMQTLIYEERTCQKFTDGSIEYSDWKVVNRQTNQVKINSW